MSARWQRNLWAMAAGAGCLAVVAAGRLAAAAPGPGPGALAARAVAALAVGQDNVGLASSVQSLKGRHLGAVTRLPGAQREEAPVALTVVEELPLLIQEAYFVTVEDYPTLEPSMQRRTREVIRRMARLPRKRVPEFVETVDELVAPLEDDPVRIVRARREPHRVLLEILPVLRDLSPPEPEPDKGEGEEEKPAKESPPAEK